MQIIETERLLLRQITTDDAPFILALLNDPSWIQFIGDRGVRTLDAARDYILERMMKSYEQNGFGLYLTVIKADKTPIGICGLVNRDGLDDIDIGFAFLPTYKGLGYGYESSTAVVSYAKTTLKLNRLVAITDQANTRSIRLLEKLGFRFEKNIILKGDSDPVALYVLTN